MFRSFRMQVLWAPLLALAGAAALFGHEAHSRMRQAEQLEALVTLRQQLERVVLRLLDRHERTVRRAREAMLEPRLDSRVAILSWSSEHYQREMERYLNDAKAALAAASLPGADAAQLQGDMQRIGVELERVRARIEGLAAALDLLLEAVATEDPATTTTALQELYRADRDISTFLRRIANNSLRRAMDWQARHLANQYAAPPAAPWIIVALWFLLALVLAYRPLTRLRRAALTDAPFEAAASAEETALARRVGEGRDALAQVEADLGRRTRELERTTQSTRRAERELALLRLYNENLVNSLRSAIAVTELAGQLTGFNRVARDLLELSDTSLGAPVDAHPLYTALAARSPQLREELERAGDERRALRFDAVPYRHQRGERVLDVNIVPYLDESGAARGFLWVCDDVTEAVTTKNQLLAAERLAAVGRLSAQVAHEIRNPLSAIGLNAELLQEDFATTLAEPQRGEALALLRAIGSEVERLTEVTEGYLQLARLPRPDFRDTDLNLLVSDLLTMLNEELKSHGIVVTVELATPAPHAWADPGQLRQGMLNIIRNAREAMPEGGALHIRTKQDDDTATIEVRDSGPGIAPQTLHRVFEPFYSTKREGTGLGLSLTRQIMVEHGGSIELLANEPHGLLVRLQLPRPRKSP